MVGWSPRPSAPSPDGPAAAGSRPVGRSARAFKLQTGGGGGSSVSSLAGPIPQRRRIGRSTPTAPGEKPRCRGLRWRLIRCRCRRPLAPLSRPAERPRLQHERPAPLPMPKRPARWPQHSKYPRGCPRTACPNSAIVTANGQSLSTKRDKRRIGRSRYARASSILRPPSDRAISHARSAIWFFKRQRTHPAPTPRNKRLSSRRRNHGCPE